MKKLMLLVILFSYQLVWASEALSTYSMDDVINKVEEKVKQYGREKVLLVFDIDNTILTMNNDLGSDQWFSWQEKIIKEPNCEPLCITKDINELLKAQNLLFAMGTMRATESTLPTKVKALQESGQKIILLTSRDHSLRSLTEGALGSNSYNFQSSTLAAVKDVTGTYLPYDLRNLAASGLNQYDVDTAGLKDARLVSFQNGVYMTAGQNKGVMLKALLKKYKKNYKAIIFADDHERHVVRMQAILGNILDVTTYHYHGVKAEVDAFNAKDKTEVTSKWLKLKETIKEIGF